MVLGISVLCPTCLSRPTFRLRVFKGQAIFSLDRLGLRLPILLVFLLDLPMAWLDLLGQCSHPPDSMADLRLLGLCRRGWAGSKVVLEDRFPTDLDPPLVVFPAHMIGWIEEGCFPPELTVVGLKPATPFTSSFF